MTIEIETVFTPYNAATKVKPRGVLWYFKNIGRTWAYINGNYRMDPGEEFGIDLTDFIPPNVNNIASGMPSVPVINNTQFDVSFGDRVFFGVTGAPEKQMMLCETFFKIKK